MRAGEQLQTEVILTRERLFEADWDPRAWGKGSTPWAAGTFLYTTKLFFLARRCIIHAKTHFIEILNNIYYNVNMNMIWKNMGRKYLLYVCVSMYYLKVLFAVDDIMKANRR